MKSPFTGGEATLHQEERTMEFRKEKFEIYFQYYLCSDTGERFTDEQLDEVNTNQVFNKYREKYGIPFPDEIKAVREQYGLSASKMSDILGLGINAYRNYETGEMPSVSNGRMIQMVKDPKEFKQLIDYSKNEFTPEELERINKKLDHKLKGWSLFENLSEELMLGEKRPSLLNGYRIPDLNKVNNMILYFAQKAKPFKTKMNKLLFYSDFLHFKMSCFSISGLTYKAIQKGPVPKNYDWIFDNTLEKKLVNIVLHDFDEYRGEQFVADENAVFNEELFAPSELKAMQIVADSFKKDTVNEIVDKSHKESAWAENVDGFKIIDYKYSFSLKYPEEAN